MSEETWGFYPICVCEPFVLAKGEVWNGSAESQEECPGGEWRPGRQDWDLTPYQEAGLLKKDPDDPRPVSGLVWRLVETDYPSYYNGGSVDEDGTLDGLADEFAARECYVGYMALQIGCDHGNGNIDWPPLGDEDSCYDDT